MAQYRYLKKFLFPGSVCAAVVKASTNSDVVCGSEGQLVRRSELPVYGTEDCRPSESACKSPSSLEKQVSSVRKELWVWYDEYKGYRQKVVDVIDTGTSHTKVLLEQLQADELPLPRVGAVALGGLAGLVLGLRRRWPRRILYTAIGATAMAALCYPREGAELVQQSHVMAKKYLTITYNFIYGVKPEGLKLPTPEKLLASLGGATELAKPEMQPSQPSSPQASPGPQTSKQNPPSTIAVVADGGLKARFESSAEECDDMCDKEEFHIPVEKHERACYCLDPNEEGHTTTPLPCKPQPLEEKKGEGGDGVAKEVEVEVDEEEGEGSVYVVDGKCRGDPDAD